MKNLRSSDVSKLVKAVLAFALVLTVMALCFGLPTVHSGAHDIEVGITGDTQAVSNVEHAAAQSLPGALKFKTYPDARTVRRAVENRDIAGAVLAGGQHTSVLIATAGGPPLAQELRELALALGHGEAGAVPVTDLAAYPAHDPMGGGIASAGLPLIFGGILPALLLAKIFRRRTGFRVGGAVLFSLLAGVVVAALLQFVYRTTEHDFLLVAGGVALGLGAISLPALGLEATFGTVGFAAMSVGMILVGNPLSGLASSPAWLPSPWGAVGQLLPPGASGSLLRSNAFFDGRGAGAQVITLCCWVAAGSALCWLGARRPAIASSLGQRRRGRLGIDPADQSPQLVA